MKNACKMTIKQVPASQVDSRADRRARCSHWDYKHDNDNGNDDDDMDMDIAARLVQRQSLGRSRSQTHVGVALSVCTCVCVCVRVFVGAQSEDKQFIVCKCLVVVARGLRSAICDPSCIFTLACTFDHCQHACFVCPAKWAAAPATRG